MVHITIGPNSALQVIAWSKMLLDYSQSHTLAEAAEMTFDGDHPCPLCLAIAESRDEEKEDPALPPESLNERHELFPQQDLKVTQARSFARAKSSPSAAPLLGYCRFVPDLTTPPPQFG